MALNKVQGPSTGPTEYIKAAFQWLNSLLDPIRDIWVRNVGSEKDNNNLKALHQIDATIIDMDEKIEKLEIQIAVAIEKQMSSDLSFFSPSIQTHIGMLKNTKLFLERATKPLENPYLERKRQQEIQLLTDRISKLEKMDMLVSGPSNKGRDLGSLRAKAQTFADRLAKVQMLLIDRGWGLNTFDIKSSNIIHDLANELAQESSLPLLPEEIKDITKAVEARLLEKFKDNQKIKNPEELALQIAAKQTERLAQELTKIIRQNFNH